MVERPDIMVLSGMNFVFTSLPFLYQKFGTHTFYAKLMIRERRRLTPIF